jgi:hypothetical protein
MPRVTWLLLLTAMLGALVGVRPAHSLVIVEEGTTDKISYFRGPDCAPRSVGLAAPRNTRNVRAETLPVGATVTAFDEWGSRRSLATITDVSFERSGIRPVVTWTATPDTSICGVDEFGDSLGWYTVDRRFTLSWQKRERVVMTKTMARKLTTEAMFRMFSFFEHTYGDTYRCRRTSRHSARCTISFFIGDGVYSGAVRSRISADGRHRRLLWSYRASMLLTDEYCVYVSHQPPCHRRFRKVRNEVRFPAWVR